MSGTLTLGQFDYLALEPDAVKIVLNSTQKIRGAARTSAESLIAIGRELAVVRDALKEEGKWLIWLEKEFQWSMTMAYSAMRIAENYKDYRKLDYAPSALRLLAAPSTPESARVEANDRVESGEHVGLRAAEEIVEEHKGKNGTLPSANGTGKKKAASKPAEESPEPAPVEILKDRNGDRVPEHLLPVFANDKKLMSITARINEALQELAWAAEEPHGLWLHQDSVKTHLDNAKKGVLDARPAYLCPECKAKLERQKTCTFCKKKGWLPRDLYKQVTEK